MKHGLFLILFFLSYSGVSQLLQVEIRSPDKKLKRTASSFEGSYRDSADLSQRINQLKAALYAEGFIFSRARIIGTDSLKIITIEPGRQVHLRKFELQTPGNFVLPIMAARSDPAKAPGFYERIQNYLTVMENNGYPFASLSILNYQLESDTLKIQVGIDPGPLLTIDSIAVKGFEKFPSAILKYDLRYRKGMLYSEEYIRQLPEKIDRIEYLSVLRAPAVAFTKDKTILYLYLEEVKSNQVNGVLGLNTTEEGEVTLNGDFQLRLLHAFKKGEEFNIRWRAPDRNVQSLDFSTTLPYLFKTPFWTGGSLNIFRQDSSFVNTRLEGLLKYLIETGSFITGGIHYHSSNVLNSDPDDLDALNSFKTTSYKLGLELNKTNRALVPTRGFAITAYGITGIRTTGDIRQEQYGWEVYSDKYFAFIYRHILKFTAQSNALFGENLFENELFRIGGLKTLRGFNEQSIYTSLYGIGKAEYRYMIGTYDYLAGFIDMAYVENKSGAGFSTNVFTGLGAGINFQTAGGIFSLFLAVGRDDDNPWDLRASKVHFGYVNRF